MPENGPNYNLTLDFSEETVYGRPRAAQTAEMLRLLQQNVKKKKKQ